MGRLEDPDDGCVFDSLPVLANEDVGEPDVWAILTPDGTVHMPYMGKFESVADWLVSLKIPGREDMFRKFLSGNRKRRSGL